MFTRQTWPVLVVAAVAAAAFCRSFSGSPARRVSDATSEVDVGSEELRLQVRFLKWSSAARDRIAEGVIGGDLTLWEAAACYGRLDAQMPAGLEAMSAGHGESSEEERQCRHVIRFVRVALVLSGQDLTLVPELEAELEDGLRVGPVRLPAPPPGLVERYELDWR
jgi:hypothetical protein